ncbi:putative pentatricopeptide repeat-containing protein At5g37570 [Phragmites australis]|uniref:putative pentatricopeptide repeat-containing protein At5g37570 n=1 Tax=Phragmites australis TaxID=29695 RepID=UPI002D7A11E8|nr:putative pentatricopeptide repeat-containing protein At5g37570 [Phragmites australis]XP_062185346.1 putative pentatricopeptide repeat-containing protein At5g37570 [Phragmites australis]XP_062185347.1 putative pentatricopeptide repeat-containing protein At5g37570 [Phragmites australis]XP_062185348.1 putative pentatricopeptide repeat-containing protein At5g37570 [Phragmites australis]XP_062185349.1 putative pentatricopeptide repeat-containing protein At5g37570 [Phragmites australis]XP_0621853
MTAAAGRPSPPVATLLGRCLTAPCLAQLHARIVRLGLHDHHANLARFAAARPSPPVATLLGRCGTPRCLAQLHARIVRLGLHNHHALLARFAAACDALACPSVAASVLAALPDSHAAPLRLRNAVLASLARHAPLPAALAEFNLLRRGGSARPDSFSFPSLLRACAHVTCLPAGAALHAAAIRLGVDADLFVRTALIQFYGRCGAAGAARVLFDLIDIPSEVSWTAIIVAHVNTGDIVAARELFDRMPHRNVVHWNAMVDGYVKCGDLEGARTLFDEMPERTATAYTSLIGGYTKAGNLEAARSLFDRLEDRDVFSWSAMISGYAQNGYPGEALRIFNEFHEQGVHPDELVIVGLMSACSQIGNVVLARWIEDYIAKYSIDMNNVHVLAGLVNMNAKCGDLERATFFFESMPVRDVFSYCSMMQGHCLHGSANKAVELFSRMLLEGLSPDNAVFTVVLTACAHTGLVEEGKKYFDMMKNVYLIVPSGDHYACLVSLLGRCGLLKDAYELIKSMPGKPHPGAWGALLAGCKVHCDIELGKIAAKKLFEIEPDNAGNYVSLSNIYANIDRWGDVSEVRDEMTEKGIVKIIGRTLVLP